ncbi:hypothetical protein DFJ74DRAFT_674949 [Hyaloraphidium curvatum]|nr:hypothetical protein DFJ74DRAFT_674949 [Hyaloraphidium curvatum]
MAAQSKPENEGAAAGAAAKPRSKPPWWIIFVDWPDAIAMLGFLGALIAFNKSDFARRFYADLAKRFPDKLERARHMLDINGSVQLYTFWTLAALYAVLDLLKWPKFLYQFRIQKGDPPKASWYLKVAVWNFAAQSLVMGPFANHVLEPLWWKRGGAERALKIPSVGRMVKEWFICEAWVQFWLYTSHRIMHLPWLYKWTHKRHHYHTNPMVIANFYGTPFEYIFQNTLATAAEFLLPIHPSTMWFFGAYHNWETATSHSGYAIPFATNALQHNYHHRMFEGLYGLHSGMPIMDMIFGTADEYFQWRWEWLKTHHWLWNTRLDGVKDEEAEKVLNIEGVDRDGVPLI